VNATTFVILAVGPEAESNENGFNAAVKRAKDRLAALQKKSVQKKSG
jgi:flavin-binding protein dodecin